MKVSSPNKKSYYIAIGIIIFQLSIIIPYPVWAASLSATPTPSQLTEDTLDGVVIRLTVFGDQFIQNISIIDFELLNYPPGTRIGRVERISNTEVDVILAFDRTDFDVNYTNLQIKVLKNSLEGDNDIESNSITIVAVNESKSVLGITNPTELHESNLDGSKMSLILYETAFSDVPNADHFQLNNVPSGMKIKIVEKLNDFTAEITLDYDGTDISSDITNFNITVLDDVLSESGNLTSNNMTIKATTQVEGEGVYVITGESYPTLIQVAGYNIRDKELYINYNLETTKNVNAGEVATFNYFLEIFDDTSSLIGTDGTLASPITIDAQRGEQSVSITDENISLSKSLTREYRIVITVKRIDISS